MEFKSAGAFFFLFFLHGFSIGNGQQGISYNVFQIPEGGGLRSTKFNTKTMFNRSENVHITTKAPSFGYVLL